MAKYAIAPHALSINVRSFSQAVNVCRPSTRQNVLSKPCLSQGGQDEVTSIHYLERRIGLATRDQVPIILCGLDMYFQYINTYVYL